MNKKENHSAKSEIEQALLRLMTQKSYMDITVTDIVQEAKVARVSFYRNFASISEVLDSIADATAEKLNIEFLPMLDTTDERKIREYLFNYFYQISLNYKEMWAIRGLNMDLFTKRLGEKIHEKRKAVESADPNMAEKYADHQVIISSLNSGNTKEQKQYEKNRNHDRQSQRNFTGRSRATRYQSSSDAFLYRRETLS